MTKEKLEDLKINLNNFFVHLFLIGREYRTELDNEIMNKCDELLELIDEYKKFQE